MNDLRSKSRTAKLWLAYIDDINTLKLFVFAESTGDWNTHLVAIGRMLNIFAASGHFNYAKSARLYLQWMFELPATSPWLYGQFCVNGFHAVRRSDRFWSGLWTELIIEQVMVKSIKNRGGLTRGRGMTESVRILCKCAEIHEAMTSVTNLAHRTSEQHVELGNARRQRDFTNVTKVINWLTVHNPFDVNLQSLRSLSSGFTASDSDGINYDEMEEVGRLLQQKLENVNFLDGSMKRSDKVITLANLQKCVKMLIQTLCSPDLLSYLPV